MNREIDFLLRFFWRHPFNPTYKLDATPLFFLRVATDQNLQKNRTVLKRYTKCVEIAQTLVVDNGTKLNI